MQEQLVGKYEIMKTFEDKTKKNWFYVRFHILYQCTTESTLADGLK